MSIFVYKVNEVKHGLFILQTDLPNKKWGNSSGAAGVSGQLANAITLAFLLFILFVAIRVREALRQDRIAEKEETEQLAEFKKKLVSRSNKTTKPNL